MQVVRGEGAELRSRPSLPRRELEEPFTGFVCARPLCDFELFVDGQEIEGRLLRSSHQVPSILKNVPQESFPICSAHTHVFTFAENTRAVDGDKRSCTRARPARCSPPCTTGVRGSQTRASVTLIRKFGSVSLTTTFSRNRRREPA